MNKYRKKIGPTRIGTHARYNFNHYFGFAVNRRFAAMELQPELGICSLWRVDNDTDHYLDFMVVGRHLNGQLD